MQVQREAYVVLNECGSLTLITHPLHACCAVLPGAGSFLAPLLCPAPACLRTFVATLCSATAWTLPWSRTRWVKSAGLLFAQHITVVMRLLHVSQSHVTREMSVALCLDSCGTLVI